MITLTEIKISLIAQGGNLPGVYKITRKSDGHVYIGQTEKPMIDRIEQHINNVKATTGIDAAIQKEGLDAFDYEVEVYIPNATTEQLWDLESQYIAKYDSSNPSKGFNLTKGNHRGLSIKNTISYVMHSVTVETFKKRIARGFNLKFTEKSVLLINCFSNKVIDYLAYEDCKVTVIKSSAFIKQDKKGNSSVNGEAYGEYIMKELEKLQGQHFDIVIANPPYNTVGATITRKIIETIDYTDFINLMPANDYHRGKDDLYKYADLDSMKPVLGEFEDAAVTTHVARISKTADAEVDEVKFEIENYIDPSLTKYFYVTRARAHYAIDNYEELHKMESPDSSYSVYIAGRDINHKHLPYTKESLTYKWNVEKISYAQAAAYSQKQAVAKGELYFYGNTITFSTTTEKDNFIKFLYSVDGFKFFSKAATAVTADGRFCLNKILPKVDWSREWTVEEILADYGYTENEIKVVMDDIHMNTTYKYIND